MAPAVDLPDAADRHSHGHAPWTPPARCVSGRSDLTPTFAPLSPMAPQQLPHGCVQDVYMGVRARVHTRDVRGPQDPIMPAVGGPACTWDGTALWVFGGRSKLDETVNKLHRVCITEDGRCETETMPTTGDWPRPRSVCGYCEHNGMMVIYGGVADTTHDDVWTFTFQTRQWTQRRPPDPTSGQFRRFAMACAKDGGDNLYCFGGCSGTREYTNTLRVLNLRTFRLSHVPAGSEPPPRGSASAVVYQRQFVVVGGADHKRCFGDAWVLPLGGDELPTWRRIDCTVGPLVYGAATVVQGGRIVMFGGARWSASEEDEPDAWCLDLADQAWRKILFPGPSLNRAYMGVAPLRRNEVLLFGGRDAEALVIKFADVWKVQLQELSSRRMVAMWMLAGGRMRGPRALPSDLKLAVMHFLTPVG